MFGCKGAERSRGLHGRRLPPRRRRRQLPPQPARSSWIPTKPSSRPLQMLQGLLHAGGAPALAQVSGEA